MYNYHHTLRVKLSVRFLSCPQQNKTVLNHNNVAKYYTHIITHTKNERVRL